MKDEGWTMGDLLGELMVRGIDIDDFSDSQLASVLDKSNPNQAAEELYDLGQGKGNR